MLRTVQISNYQLVQGEFLHEAADGQISVMVYGKVYVGRPVILYMRGAAPVQDQWDEIRLAG